MKEPKVNLEVRFGPKGAFPWLTDLALFAAKAFGCVLLLWIAAALLLAAISALPGH